MKKLEISVPMDVLVDHTYLVSRENKLYSFFKSEYTDLAKDAEGNLLVPYQEERKSQSVMQKLKDRIKHKDSSVVVSYPSEAYTYFLNEYKTEVIRNAEHEIIIPQGLHPYTKKK